MWAKKVLYVVRKKDNVDKGDIQHENIQDVEEEQMNEEGAFTMGM